MAQFVDEEPGFPGPVSADPRQIWPYLISVFQRLSVLFLTYAQRLNLCLPKDGSEAMSGPLPLAQYTTATKPAASAANKGCVIYVTDGGAGNVFQGSNGSSWVSLG